MNLTCALLSRLVDPSIIEDGASLLAKVSQTTGDFEVINPANGERLATLPEMGANETRAAIDAAYAVQNSWAGKTAKERSVLLRKLHNLMLANADDLACILTMEMGKPLAEARGEIVYGASYVEWFAEEAKRVYGDVIPPHQSDKRILVLKQPIGVVGVITPWNFPCAMLARKLAPALAAGCAVVAKPAHQTPLSAIALAVLAQRAGLPEGVFNLITGSSGSVVGKEMCANDKLRKISFTGSTEVGRILMRQGADKILRMSMELGGNAPFIVFDDADIEAALEGAMISKYRNAGQTCVCANRIYVHNKVHDQFAVGLVERVATLKLGEGVSEGVTTGPLIDAKALAKVEEHIEDAVARGAKVLVGGRKSDLGDLFFEPTVITGATNSMRLAREEIFGPIAPLYSFDDEQDLIDMANDTEYGLAAYFYTKDLSRAWRVTEALEYGIVGVNTGLISSEVAPFGGVKQSGQGREGSKYGLDDYLEMKYVCLGGIQ